MSELHSSGSHNKMFSEHPTEIAKKVREMVVSGLVDLEDCSAQGAMAMDHITTVYRQDSGWVGLLTTLYLLADTDESVTSPNDPSNNCKLSYTEDGEITFEVIRPSVPEFVEMYDPSMILGNFTIEDDSLSGLWLMSRSVYRHDRASEKKFHLGVVSVADSEFTRASEARN